MHRGHSNAPSIPACRSYSRSRPAILSSSSRRIGEEVGRTRGYIARRKAARLTSCRLFSRALSRVRSPRVRTDIRAAYISLKYMHIFIHHPRQAGDESPSSTIGTGTNLPLACLRARAPLRIACIINCNATHEITRRVRPRSLVNFFKLFPEPAFRRAVNSTLATAFLLFLFARLLVPPPRRTSIVEERRTRKFPENFACVTR